MKVYVDELPKDCIGCSCESEYYCNLLKEDIGCCKWGEIHKNCPLQSIFDHDKQVRKEVVEEIRSRFLATCQIEKECDTASFSLEVLNRILDQLQESQGEKK